MTSPPKKSWKLPLFKERNEKIRRLRAEGMSLSILSKRFGLRWDQLRKILKEQEDE
jgi:hypothetical protein